MRTAGSGKAFAGKCCRFREKALHDLAGSAATFSINPYINNKNMITTDQLKDVKERKEALRRYL